MLCPELKWIKGDMIEIRDILELRDRSDPMLHRGSREAAEDGCYEIETMDTASPWVRNGLDYLHIPTFVNSQ